MNHGRYFPGTVTSASTSESLVNDIIPVKSLHVGYTYQVNGQTYSSEAAGDTSRESELKPGAAISVCALPQSPQICCSIFDQPGNKSPGHFLLAALLVLINVVIELFIWLPAMYHKSFARSGIAIGAEILTKSGLSDSDGDKYDVTVKYDAGGRKVEKNFSVPIELYSFLQQGQLVSLLYKPGDICNAMLYASCWYEPYSEAYEPYSEPMKAP